VTAAIVVANMIGTGVFTSTGFQARDLHDPMTILLAWVIGGVIALCGAAAYAELGSMMPRAGGEYVYLREAYHPSVGFMSGWVSLTAGFSAPIAVAALFFARYLGTVFPELQMTEPWAVLDLGFVSIKLGLQHAIAMGLIVAITALHSFDTKVGWVRRRSAAGATDRAVHHRRPFAGDGNWPNEVREGTLNVGFTSFAVALMCGLRILVERCAHRERRGQARAEPAARAAARHRARDGALRPPEPRVPLRGADPRAGRSRVLPGRRRGDGEGARRREAVRPGFRRCLRGRRCRGSQPVRRSRRPARDR
jgi:hypothetical protein